MQGFWGKPWAKANNSQVKKNYNPRPDSAGVGHLNGVIFMVLQASVRLPISSERDRGSLQSLQAAMKPLGVIITLLVVLTAIIPLCVATGGGGGWGPGASGCPEPTFLMYLVSK